PLRLNASLRSAQVRVLRSRNLGSFGHSPRWRLLLSLKNAILLFIEVMTTRGRSRLTSVSPVFLLFRSASTNDQLPFCPFVNLTANREMSKGKLNPTSRSPFLRARQNTYLMKRVLVSSFNFV